MEGSRVKTVIIMILLVVNGFLLVLVGARRSEARRYEQSALDGSIQVLAQNGIVLSSDAISGREGYQSGTTQRDPELEARLASALLGEAAEGSSRGGGLYTYSTEHGQISFRAGGELSAQLKQSDYWSVSDPESYSDALADRLGLSLRRTRCEIREGSGEIVYQQLVDSAPLFPCRLVLTFEQGQLTDLSGSLLAMDKLSAESEALLSLPTVLMRFLDSILDSGDVCSAILLVEPGYLITQSFTGTVGLQPVWHITTNTADYYVNGITGELSRAVG